MDQYWQKFAQELLLQAIPILIPLAIAWIGKLCVEVWEKIKSRKPELALLIEEAARFSVLAAEQVGLSGALSEFANSKLEYAIQVAEKYLATRGIKHIDLDLLRAAIEAEVKKADFPHVEKTQLLRSE